MTRNGMIVGGIFSWGLALFALSPMLWGVTKLLWQLFKFLATYTGRFIRRWAKQSGGEEYHRSRDGLGVRVCSGMRVLVRKPIYIGPQERAWDNYNDYLDGKIFRVTTVYRHAVFINNGKGTIQSEPEKVLMIRDWITPVLGKRCDVCMGKYEHSINCTRWFDYCRGD